MQTFFGNEKWHTRESLLKNRSQYTFNTGSRDIVEDFNRMIFNNQIFINGENAKIILKKKGIKSFSDESQVKKFIEDHILLNIEEKLKKKAIDFCMENLHQGSLLAPVSATLCNKLAFKADGKTFRDDCLSVINPTRAINICFAENTFLVTEAVAIEKGQLRDPKKSDKEIGAIIEPDKQGDSILEAQATFKVEFNSEQPTISVVESFMRYGNETVKEKLDNRDLLEMLLDWLERTFSDINSKYNIDEDSLAAKKNL